MKLPARSQASPTTESSYINCMALFDMRARLTPPRLKTALWSTGGKGPCDIRMVRELTKLTNFKLFYEKKTNNIY